eukprot:CAMPEP_0119315246 /NCGR_PEP_ID=MMETSP1333-20130426/34992_1 /TAXON_ID=418940 /ORGANISM="Scyphosphaera apsteinii, Strain RCC1455" /LENGTH=162 /DNA_ID=CAMNT_0007320539 /DNA_START=200 /DNA_END=688 /DNA_ORIENTATION=-
MIGGCFSAIATQVALSLPAAGANKGYITMEDYNRQKALAKKDEALYGRFEALRTRAMQTSEFDALAEKDDFTSLSNLARAWDSSIRKELLEPSIIDLDAEGRSRGGEINKVVLNDLKSLDKLAKGGKKEEVPIASATLRQHVLEFVALEPTRLVEKFGVSDL